MGRVARIGLLTLAFWGALLVCLSGTAAHADTGPTLPISHSGRWLTDAAGRVVIIHGVNIVEKRAPYSPDSHGFNPGVGKFIQSLGFNGARLGLLWAGVEPSAGVYDQQYVNQVHADADTLASDGVMSLVDFHQDLMNEQFGGEGFPTWAVQSDGLPAQPLTGFPLSYASSPGENAAWLNFYNNARDAEGIGLQDSYAKAWQFAAASFASDRSLIGYDLINEPWSLVTNAPLCVLGCAGFEHGTLAPFEARVMRSIRGSDPQHLLFYEPVVETQFGLGAYDMPNPDRDPEAAMSYHAYCLVSGGSCPGSERRAFENGLNDASANGDAGLLSEFGATNDLSLVQPLIADADAKMEGWMWWAPNLTGYFSDSYTDLAANDPQWPAIKALAEPYPQVTAGTPLSYGFDAGSGQFEFRYSTTRAGSASAFGAGSLTSVSTPGIEFPAGYRVSATGAAVVSAPGAAVLSLAQCPGASRVQVSVQAGSPSAAGGSCQPDLSVRLRAGTAPADRTVSVRRVLGSWSAPAAGALISVAGSQIRLNSAGTGVLHAIPSGRQRLVASLPGNHPATAYVSAR